MSETKPMKASEIISLLAQQLPALAGNAEQERDWVWLVGDFRKDDATRKAIGKDGLGFRFTPKPHNLKSGRQAHWFHMCDKPMFFRKGGGKWNGKKKQDGTVTVISQPKILTMLGIKPAASVEDWELV